MCCTRWRRALGLAGCALALGSARTGVAQSITQPAQAWRTVTTQHFIFHTPAQLEAWTRHVASRMESYAAAVTAFVGNAPKERVTVLVDDPSGDPNGFAVPLLGGPLIMIWPTPPSPSLGFGEFREWGEILAVHEFAHIAHLTYPSRNPRERFWWSFLPARVGPVALRTPAWVFEGFATLVEGRLTGDGRPHSAGRAAVLRQWALAGKLPPYSGLDNAGTFMGGAMRYLVGSAYLEWLVERKGDASLERVWRRLSAREPRSFAQAFAGVYGAAPDELYGQFVVDVTERALRARAAVRSLAPSEGALFQHIEGATGEPAISPDASLLAVPLRRIGQPARLVVWRADAAGIDSAFVRRRAQILARDPLDVTPFDSFPLPRRTVATLRAVAGAGYNNPRWLPGGKEILVSREVPLGNGYSRADLFLWNWKAGRVRRVTRGAGIRFADPSPDGRRAVATRCDAGRCGLALVNLTTGSWRQLVRGGFDEVWHRPRWSPDGRRIAASVHRDGRWQIALLQANGEAAPYFAPNDGNPRYSPVWVGDELIVVSERGGVPNLELLNPAGGGVHTITRSLGAVAAPDRVAYDGAIWYLDLHAKGWDIRRYASSVAPSPDTIALSRDLAPVAPVITASVPSFDSAAVSARNYGLGPRTWRYWPGFAAGADGAYGLLAITNYDPAGKLGVLAQGAYGQRRVWRGASLGAAWHGWPAFDLVATAFTTQLGAPNGSSNPRFDGGALAVGRAFDYGATSWTWQIGANAGHVDLSDSSAFHRAQAYAELGLARRRSYGFWRTLSLGLHGSAGETGTSDVRRGMATLGVTTAFGNLRLRLAANAGRVSLRPDSSGSAGFETFAIGGLAPPLFDSRVLPQRISLPALPAGSAAGRAFVSYRTTLSAPGLPASLYGAWSRVYDPHGDWNRLIGAEGEQAFASIGFASLPNVSLQYGAAYSIDDPRRRRWTLYAGARFAP